MKTRFTYALLVAGVALAGCNQGTPPMAGNLAGTGGDSLSTAARERGGAGCPATSAGMPMIAGSKGDEPLIVRTSPGRGTAGGTTAMPIAPGGEASSCN